MTILWELDEKHSKQVSPYGAQPLKCFYYMGKRSKTATRPGDYNGWMRSMQRRASGVSA
jgi:hypothetical protein